MKTAVGWMLVVAGTLLTPGCGPKDPKKPDAASSGNPATAPLDYLAAQGRAKQTAIRVTSTAELTGAIEKFHAMEDRYPRDLNELVQQRYLQSVPEAPRGKAFQYNSQDGTFRLVPAP